MINREKTWSFFFAKVLHRSMRMFEILTDILIINNH